MSTLINAVIEITIGGTVIIYGEGSTPVITQQITEQTTTTPANKAVFDALDDKLSTSAIQQTTGTATDKVMSQDAVTKALASIEIPDIVDNLESHDVDKTLSAAQGSVIYGMIENLYDTVSGNKEYFDDIFIVNLLNNDLSAFFLDKRLQINGGAMIDNASQSTIVTSRPIMVSYGVTYSVSGAWNNYGASTGYIRGLLSKDVTGSTGRVAPIWTAIDGGYKFTSPMDGYLFIDFQLNSEKTALKTTSQIEVGDVVNRHIEYGERQVNPNLLPDYSSNFKELSLQITEVDTNLRDFKEYIIVKNSHNILNPDNFKFDRRYSTGSLKIIVADGNAIVSSGLVEVKEGEWYTVSGNGIYGGYQGGYFPDGKTGAIGDASIGNIAFIAPVSGEGRAFQVPIGLGVKYALISLGSNADKTAIIGNAQMELGEMATIYQPFELVDGINPNLLPSSDSGGGSIIVENKALDKYTTFGNVSHNIGNKLPNFRKHWINKDKDLVIAGTGTSLTARSIEHCTDHKNAKFRPPLMHSNNFASHIWDALKWEGQEYRRYDSAYFSESGVWLTASNVEAWDDNAYRSGLTRYSDDIASRIAYLIPMGAWQSNLIYRSDSLGSDNCKIAITEGNGYVEVLNEQTGLYVEANGFVFSMKESAVSGVNSVDYIRPTSELPVHYNFYQTKGNTTYQKRLRMRCKSDMIDSRSENKHVTISRESGRLLYWGTEWSPREFMITYINAARGSYSITFESERCLSRHQDNEIWGFKPDLILTENPIHNSGGSGIPNSTYPTTYWARITNNFFFDKDVSISLLKRAESLGINNLEWVIFNSSITWNFNGIDENGQLIVGLDRDNRALTALDTQMMSNEALRFSNPNAIVIDAVKHFVSACFSCYGNMKDATIGSGKNGKTFTNEGSHWNDTGSRVMARIVLPILDMYN